MMPPQGAPRPDAATSDALRGRLEQELDRAAAARPNPGRPMLHRLNRVEYGNAVRDLLALKVDVASLLPPDDSGYGFDNIADLLGVSPVLLERYLEAAGRISDLAVGDRNAVPTAIVYRVRQDASQDKHVEGLPLGTVGGTAVEPTLPLDGEYELRVKLFRTNLGTMRGLEYPQRLEIAVDGRRVHLAGFGGNEDVAASSDNPTTTGNAVDERLRVRLPLTAGPHKITVAFLAKSSVQGGRRLQPWQRSSSDTVDFAGYPHVDTFTVAGPFNPTSVGDTPSRRAIFVCRPAAAADETPCARRIITTLARRAYRGTGTDADVQRLLDFYAAGRREGTFDEGVAVALRRLLTSPKFLFRSEHDPDALAPGSVFRVSDLELASRLSFFLWSSIPDDELLDVAGKGRLSAPGVLARQVRRMLADPRSQSLIENFAGQWLYLRNLPGHTWGSLLFAEHVAPQDDLPVARLRAAGAVIVGKTNTPELALAGYTDNRLFGATGNPWAPTLTPGGSSGGAVAGVSAGFGPLAVATDAGGSIRRPSGHTGVAGLKPGVGRVPRRYGFPPLAQDLQVIGLVARAIADLQLAFAAISTTQPERRDAPPAGRSLRIGAFGTVGDAPVDPPVTAAFAAACEALREMGHTVEIIPAP